LASDNCYSLWSFEQWKTESRLLKLFRDLFAPELC
jgi:hypothetical protein